MVVLAASICTRGGKPLLSRQFRDISKDRITALLANFPSLILNSSSQHTTAEDENVRYVYQPLEELYIVLLTNKQSNILQDIDTLHLFGSTISNMLRSVDEKEIFENAFEILSAFDEIVNLGFKENLTLSQVQSFLEMDSHEEKIQEIIERNKELEAGEERKRRAKEIQRKELARRNLEQVPSMSSNSYNYDSYQNSHVSQGYQPTHEPQTIVDNQSAPQVQAHKPARGGLQLGKKQTKAAPIEQTQRLLSGSNLNFNSPSTASIATPPQQPASPAPNVAKVHNNGILITVNEKVSAELNRDGSIILSEVKGDLQLRINNPELSNSKILLTVGDKASGIQYKTHPNVDRNLFNSNSIIGLKDSSKSFPSNDQALGVLRWRVVGKTDDASTLPIVITAWVNVNDGVGEVTLEYELTSDFLDANAHLSPEDPLLQDLKILVPVPTHEVNLASESDHISYDVTEVGIIFTIDAITSNDPQGSFEFTVPVSDEDALFPLELQFGTNNVDATDNNVALGKVKVLDVVSNTEDEASLPFDLHFNLNSESYRVN